MTCVAAVGVLEGESRGSGERAGGRGDVERFVEAGGQGSVVGVERERIAELLGRLRVNEVQRLAVGVLVLLENPARDLPAAVGEGDAVELVLETVVDSADAWTGGTVEAAVGAWQTRSGSVCRGRGAGLGAAGCDPDGAGAL